MYKIAIICVIYVICNIPTLQNINFLNAPNLKTK